MAAYRNGQGINLIKYSLRCDQGHDFEGWFRNSDDCEMQTREGHLQCPYCGSTVIAKSLMTPSVSGTRSQDNDQAHDPNLGLGHGLDHSQAAEGDGPSQALEEASLPVPSLGNRNLEQGQMQQMLRAFRKHVVANSDYVGDKFAEEARKMHFEEAEPRGIYGEATVDEVKSLADDGIDCLPLPILPEDQN